MVTLFIFSQFIVDDNATHWIPHERISRNALHFVWRDILHGNSCKLLQPLHDNQRQSIKNSYETMKVCDKKCERVNWSSERSPKEVDKVQKLFACQTTHCTLCSAHPYVAWICMHNYVNVYVCVCRCAFCFRMPCHIFQALSLLFSAPIFPFPRFHSAFVVLPRFLCARHDFVYEWMK